MAAQNLPGFYSHSLDGHRAAYLDFVKSRFGGKRISGQETLFWSGPVLFLMIEENFGLYLAAALWRSVLGRRTVGLLFRPAPAIDAKSWRLRLKRAFLRGLRQLPLVQTLSIVPTPLNPRIGDIVDGWIHDFQLWDLSHDERLRFTLFRQKTSNEEIPSSEGAAILREAMQYAEGRPILIALGIQNRAKGAERLAASMSEGGTKGWAVIVAGRFAPDAEAVRHSIEAHGGRVINRFLSNEEMLALYAAANAVWCLYDPAYDQASGILGRAVQLGVPPVVRYGSYSEALCKAEGICHAAAIGGADLKDALAAIPSSVQHSSNASALATRFELENSMKLRQALGLFEDPKA